MWALCAGDGGESLRRIFLSVITPAAWCCWARPPATTLVGEIMTNKVCYVGPRAHGGSVHGADDRQKHPYTCQCWSAAVLGMVSMRDVVRATLDALEGLGRSNW